MTSGATDTRAKVRIRLDQIDRSGRLRPVNEAKAQVFAASMRDHGQLEPVEVTPVKGGAHPYRLTFGAHRCRAVELNGWDEIDAIVEAVDENTRRLREIDENLIREELSALDRALFLAERKRIYELKHPETKHGGARKGQVANMATRFSADVAERTGFGERTVQRACELAAKLTPDVIERLQDTPYSRNQAALEALSKVPAERQVAAVSLLLDEEAPAKSVADAFNRLDGRVEKAAKADNKLAKMIDAWGRMSARERGSFLSFLYEGELPAGWALASELRGDAVQRGAAWSEAAE